MNNYILYSLVLCFSFFLTWAAKAWAVKKKVMDYPNERSSHSIPTPRGGGIAIVAAFYSAILFMFITGQLKKDLFLALLPGIGLALIGVFDDLRSLSPKIRLIFQLLFSGLALYFLGGFHSFFNDNLVWLWSILALFGFVWFINLFNFLDGSDGYASMEAITITIILWYFTGMNILLILAFSIGGFLYWNWPKAKIFMGDVGSTTLGFVLIVFGVYFHNNHQFDFAWWLIITSLFWFDATITLLRRILSKEKLSRAHKNHIYQRAILGGFSHLKTMLAGLLINMLLLAICIAVKSEIISLVLGSILALLILLIALIYIDKKYPFKRVP
jgi:UDP-N-acetylmuramyl pentapeptide phosphotransferase/UDP-N-acetylglucosamine-1-phosphate transferase